MSKSILVLDENSVIHGLIASALDVEGLTLHHEFNPGMFLERASSLMPDLILIGNSEADPEYTVPRSLKDRLGETPVVLLASSKESLSAQRIRDMQVDGVVRKPFEASDLQQQVSKHLDMVDLVGSAYEYRQSQWTREEPENPLANLDVLDDEVLGMLRDEDGGRPAFGAGMVDDEVLAETLQPERAFEPITVVEEAPGEGAYDALETLEDEFPGEMDAVEVEGVEELGAQDVLDEVPPEETLLEPEGFDEALGLEAADEEVEPLEAIEVELPEEPAEESEPLDVFELPEEPAGTVEPLEAIEVELPEESIDLEAIDDHLNETDVDYFEAALDEDEESPLPPSPEEFQESIPLSVRRMMELKPVFTLGQEEESGGPGAEGGFAFEPEAGDVAAIQSELDHLDEVEMDVDIIDEEIEFVSDEEAERLHVVTDEELPELEEEELPEPEVLAAKFEEELPELGEEELPELEEEEFPELGEADLPEPEELAASVGEELPELEEEELPEPEVLAARVEEELPELDEEELPELDEEDLFEPETVAAGAEEELPPLTDEPLPVEEVAPEEDLVMGDTYSEPVMAAEPGVSHQELPLPPAGETAEIEDDFAAELLDDERPPEDLEALGEAGVLEPKSDDAAFFSEEYLGDEEIDEEQLIALDEAEELPERPELTDEDERELDELMAEEDLSGLEEVEESELTALDEDEEDIELDQEEEDLIRASLAADREAAAEPAVPELEEPEAGEPEPLFERNFNALSEEGVEAEEDTEWSLEETDSGLAVSDASDEIITLGEPVGEDLSLQAEEILEEDLQMTEVEEEEEEASWKPEVPPSFVPKPTEEFPEDAVTDPFEGPPEVAEEEPSPLPRHQPHEVLEDPESLKPVLEGDQISAAGAGEEEEVFEDAELSETLVGEAAEEEAGEDLDMDHAFEPLAGEEDLFEDGGEDNLAAMLGATDHEEAPPEYMAEETVEAEEAGEAPSLEAGEEAPAAADEEDDEFNSLFADLQAEIEANPEGERLDDVLRVEGIKDGVARLEFDMPADGNALFRAMGLYAVAGDGEAPSDYPGALTDGGAVTAAPPAPEPVATPAAPIIPEGGLPPDLHADALSLLDPEIRNKLGQVLDEIISISVRKAVQEEMPKIVERLSRGE